MEHPGWHSPQGWGLHCSESHKQAAWLHYFILSLLFYLIFYFILSFLLYIFILSYSYLFYFNASRPFQANRPVSAPRAIWSLWMGQGVPRPDL